MKIHALYLPCQLSCSVVQLCQGRSVSFLMFFPGNHFHAVITGMVTIRGSQVSQAAGPKLT